MNLERRLERLEGVVPVADDDDGPVFRLSREGKVEKLTRAEWEQWKRDHPDTETIQVYQYIGEADGDDDDD